MKIAINKRFAKNFDAYSKASEAGDKEVDLKLKPSEIEEINKILSGYFSIIAKR